MINDGVSRFGSLAGVLCTALSCLFVVSAVLLVIVLVRRNRPKPGGPA